MLGRLATKVLVFPRQSPTTVVCAVTMVAFTLSGGCEATSNERSEAASTSPDARAPATAPSATLEHSGIERRVAGDAERLTSCRQCDTGTLSGVELCVWADDCNFAIGEG